MRVLVVEDEEKTAAYLQRGLEENGFVVDVASRGDDGLHMARTVAYDVMILDVMLPGLDGWAVIATVRQDGRQTPVLFLTARDAVDDRVKGLELGADDYLVKPFAFSELLARVRSLLRRSPARQPETIKVADLDIDVVRHRACRAGLRLDLTPKEFALLSLLAEYRKHLWVVLAAALVLCAVVSYHISRRGIRPVHVVTDTARRIQPTNFGERIEADGLPAELMVVADTFNAMLDRLEQSFTRLSRFSADIAHELRTPVNNLRGRSKSPSASPGPLTITGKSSARTLRSAGGWPGSSKASSSWRGPRTPGRRSSRRALMWVWNWRPCASSTRRRRARRGQAGRRCDGPSSRRPEPTLVSACRGQSGGERYRPHPTGRGRNSNRIRRRHIDHCGSGR